MFPYSHITYFTLERTKSGCVCGWRFLEYVTWAKNCIGEQFIDLYRSCFHIDEGLAICWTLEWWNIVLNTDESTLEIQCRRVCGESPEVRFSMELTPSGINNFSWLGGDFFFLRKKKEKQKTRRETDGRRRGVWFELYLHKYWTMKLRLSAGASFLCRRMI